MGLSLLDAREGMKLYSSDKKVPLWLRVLVLIIGIVLLIWSLHILILAQSSNNWSTTEGYIVSSEWTSGRPSDEDVCDKAEVRYEYSVDGREYVGSRVAFAMDDFCSQSRAIRVVDDYPVGSYVDVYYDPDNPETSVIEPGVTGGVLVLFIVALIFTSVGILSLWKGGYLPTSAGNATGKKRKKMTKGGIPPGISPLQRQPATQLPPQQYLSAQPQYQQQPQYPPAQVPQQAPQQSVPPQTPQQYPQAPQAAPQQVPFQPDGSWICPKCGNSLAGDFVFCMSCGYKRGS